jgi:NitT/TauT family transport system substrate-binding protein
MRSSLRIAWVGAALCAAMLPGVLAADPYKTSFGPTTTDISTGHAGHSSIPATLGFWREDNLDVNVFGTAGSIAGLQLLTAGNIDFITLVAEDVMIAQMKGMPVKAVYVHSRHPISQFVVPKSAGITELKQLKGKTVGMPAMEKSPYFRGLLGEAGLSMDKDIKLIATGTGAPAAVAFQRGDIVAWASWDTAVAALENRGMEFVQYKPSYYDELLGNAIVTRTEMIEKHPEVVVGVARGIAKAVHFGLANPEAAIKIHWAAYPQTRPQGDNEAELMRDAKRIFLSRFEGYALPPDTVYGAARAAQWKRLADFMKEAGDLPAKYDPASAYTDQFIAEINKFDRTAIEGKARGWTN